MYMILSEVKDMLSVGKQE